MSYDGYLDVDNGWKVWGWAFDSRSPDEALEIEYEFSNGVCGTVRASDFRPDLKTHGLGNGQHAFSFEIPVSYGPQTFGVSARIKGTDFVLKGSGMRTRPILSVALIAGDIVNNCNLRCPFCVVDYSNIRGLKLMTEQTFRRMWDFLPGLPPGNFWLSCLHEPTMHPHFIDFIEMVPLEYRNRISFTTNLSRRLPEGFLARLANSGVHSIRISFDSRDPDIFAELRKGAKYEIFEANLKELTAQLKSASPRPHLRFITMAFRENQAEIPGLVAHSHETLGADSHEVRFMFYLPHLAHWGRDHMLNQDQWRRLETSLSELQKSMVLEICGPMNGAREQFDAEQGVAEYVARENAFGGVDDAMSSPVPDPAAVAPHLADDAIRLRMRWDGLLGIEACPEELFGVNVNRLESPSAYFHRLRVAAKIAKSSLAVTAA